ncbi:UPF0182 family protein [uncultured Agrococcus sp.]|uniref:UPF0182 family membrane protein n=1 Tax=uncultured Agrococcus sp. TaxID=382258 RepID=UPI0025E09236|nr:UPF0182 family protein [uncultured Agrococcus sp.]
MTSSAATSSDSPKPRDRRSPLLLTLVIVAALAIGFYYFTGFYTDYLWFDQLGFSEVVLVRWGSIAVMFAIGFLAMAVPLAIVMQVAFRTRPTYAQLSSQLDRYQAQIEPLRRVGMVLIPVIFGLFSGAAAASRWELVQLWLNRQPFGQTDPQFGFDISFYVFEVPFYQQVVTLLLLVVFASFAATVAMSYLYGSLRINGREFRVARATRIMLAVLAALFMLGLAANIWLGQYAALSQPSSSVVRSGAGFAAVNATIPGIQIMAGIAALVAICFVVTAVIGRWRISIVGTAMLIVASLVVGAAYPALIQRFQVDPSARTLEAEFIDRNIESTRDAFGVSEVEMVPTDTRTTTEQGQLAEDAQTTANIRIMDPALVSEAFQNLESYRQFYSFPEQLNVDRYEIDGELQDTVVTLREMNTDWLSEQSWYNQTIVYTHGYGMVAAYGNQRGPEGQPVFMQGGVPTSGPLGDYEPRIYFGQSQPEYSIVGGTDDSVDLEVDYPRGGEEGSGADNAMTTFDGEGGPNVGNLFNRLAYALQFQSEQILLSDALNSDSQILYNRDPIERVQEVAPYLTLDQTSYPAVVDGRVVWIVDGFTSTDLYPYSTPMSMSGAIRDSTNPNPQMGPNDTVNYIRNSVKGVVDAYDGSVTLYAWDTDDPILQAWQSVYPASTTSMEEMSGDLLSHVRYPQDLFKMQRAILGDYHVTNPGTFYSDDDRWRTPSEPTWTGEGSAPPQPPYYLTMSVAEQDPAFTLYSTFIPHGGEGTPNVLYGYLSVNADAGSTPGEVSEDYGRLVIQELPRDQSVPGPGQMQNNFNTDDAISVELNILERGATQVMRGNLLTVPVGGGLLYVQPVYLRSTGDTSFPVLRRVLVSFGDNIAFADTLDAALDELFDGDSGADVDDAPEGIEDDPVDPDDPDTPTEPEEPEEPSEPETPEEPISDDLAALQQELNEVLQDANQALQDREEAYANNDLVGAAEADERLQEALERAIVLSDEIERLEAEG